MKGKKAFSVFPNGSYYGEVLFTCGHSFDNMLAKSLELQDTNWTVLLSLNEKFINKNPFGFIADEIDEKEYYIIFIKERFEYTDLQISLLSHEVVHLCQYTLPDLFDRNKEQEAEAYHHSHIVRKCLTELRK